MGKRSTATTKSGKLMNPTDQARKQARRRELKRNKKQRKMVRDAVIKGRNPSQVIKELERLDAVEIAGHEDNEGGNLKEKRKKMLNNWNRLMHMVENDKEHAEQLTNMRRLWHSYQSRRSELMRQQENIRFAQSTVNIDDIPLPSDDKEENKASNVEMNAGLSTIPMPQTKSTLRDPSHGAVCPGVPSNPPPDLDDLIWEDEEEEQSEITERVQRGPEEELRPPGTGVQVDDIQMRMLKMSGQNVEQYVKELEATRRRSEKPSNSATGVPGLPASFRPPPPPAGPPPTGPPPSLPYMPMYRPAPPPLRPGVAPAGVRPPPGPPPALRPPPPAPVATGVVSAGPQISTGKVIEAKPQMRNLRSDITRFVPVTVKVKGGQQPAKRRQKDPLQEAFNPPRSSSQAPASKDDAYAQFMNEMNELL